MMFLSPTELTNLGLKTCGQDVLISPQAVIINPQYVQLGSHVRIDAFTIIVAGQDGVILDDYVHLGSASKIFGSSGRVTLQRCSGISANTCIYTANDDYIGNWLTGPTIPGDYTNVTKGDVDIQRYVIVGANSIILPKVTLGEGCAIGALTLITKHVPPGQVMVGNPARWVGERDVISLRSLGDKLTGAG